MRIIFFSCALITLCQLTYAQKNIEELSQVSDKRFYKDVFLYSTINKDLVKLLNKRHLEIENLPSIKKMGLLSVYLKDEAFRKGRRGGVTYRHDNEENKIAAGILNTSLSLIQKKLKNQNVELLTPKEFLIDEDKKRSYYGFDLNFYDTPEAKKFGEYFSKNETSKASPSSYKTLYATYEGENAEVLYNQIGGLCSELELDAAMVMEFTTQTTGKSFLFESVIISIIGPDPSGRKEGLLLGIIKYSPNKILSFGTWTDDQIDKTRFDGFEKIISRTTEYLVEVVKDEIESIE